MLSDLVCNVNTSNNSALFDVGSVLQREGGRKSTGCFDANYKSICTMGGNGSQGYYLHHHITPTASLTIGGVLAVPVGLLDPCGRQQVGQQQHCHPDSHDSPAPLTRSE